MNILETAAAKSCPEFLEIKNAQMPQMGLGVFAKKKLKKGVVLGKYIGEVLTTFKFHKRYPEPPIYAWLKNTETKRFKKELSVWKKNKRQGTPPLPCAPIQYPENRSGYYIVYQGKRHIDAEDPEKSNWTRFINHKPFSKKANTCFTSGNINIKTSRDIEPGEELYINYGSKFFEQVHYPPL